MNDFLTKNISTETLKRFKECFDNNQSPKELKVIDWQFLQTPVNKKFVSILIDKQNEVTAAIYAVFPVSFKIEDKTYIATQSLDTITDVNYRGKGLFIKLAKEVYNKAKEDGAVLVYGFPNGNSIHGFKTKLGWEVLDPVPFLIKPLKSSYFTNKISFLKILPNINLSFSRFLKSDKYIIKENFSFPETVDSLWFSFSKDIKVAVQRDKKYLDWRYIQKPFEDYKIVHCYDLNNIHLGYIVYNIKEKHGGKIAYIMEFIYNLDDSKAAEQLLRYTIDKIKAENVDCILSWSFEHAPNYKNYKKAFFIKMPEKFKPIELHFGVGIFNEKFENILKERKNWFISYSDSDTV
jgi:Acetyltransferase (GNAT) domain